VTPFARQDLGLHAPAGDVSKLDDGTKLLAFCAGTA
jgi:hypothetical protein